jgi:hypothetical protein
MAVSLIPVLIVLVVALLLIGGVVHLAQRQERLAAERPTAPTLRYLVPEGQDPAAVLEVLHAEGYDAVPEGGETVVVTLLVDSPRERQRVRAALEDMDRNAEPSPSQGEPVRFLDE